MGILSELFKKPTAPRPYDWAFLKQLCLDAIESRIVPPGLVRSRLDELDYDRLTASGDAEEVVIEIWAVLKDAKIPEFSGPQAQEYLWRAAEVLRSDSGPKEAQSRLQEIEACLRRK
jgi:hypothetical protein